ncbi:MAG TPA: YopX family protein [Ktedonobacteraceae bacterium]|nr:YopX family protein [Ktedonobacteraceae bacterium]
MREIKFRARRIDTGQWVTGDYFKTPLTDENSGAPPSVGWFFLTGEQRHCIGWGGVAFVVDVATLGQYTGLKTKDGMELYEGDIVHSHLHGFNLIVKWCSGIGEDLGNEPCWHLNDGYYSLPLRAHLPWNEQGDGYIDVDILGNIYEHPDVLKTVGSMGYDPLTGEQKQE